MAYTTLKYGSSGDEVKKLQEKLGFTGADADGVYGAKTQNAVTEYQRKNGLTADGIAGEQTLGKLYGSTTNAQSAVPEAVQPASQTEMQAPSYRYDSGADNVYQQALQRLEAAKENKPTYAGTYDQQLQQIFDRIMNRENFSFDLNGDALWQQLKDQHVQQGQMAMMDVMGQTAALTGGYGNTYAQRAGQQAYHQHLQALTDQIPELYQLALSRYNQEGDRLKEQFALTGELAADEYGKYQDAQSQYWQGIDRAQAEADTAYDRGQTSWYNELQLKQQADDNAYAKQQDAYDRLANLITSTGYAPTQEELTAAGMSAAQAAAYTKYYNDNNAPSYSGKYYGSDDWDNGGVSETVIKLMQNKLGVTADGKWGDSSRAAAKKKYGTDDPAELYKHFVGSSMQSSGLPYDSQERATAALEQAEQKKKSITYIAGEVNEMIANDYDRGGIAAYIDERRKNGEISDTQVNYLRQLAGL